MSLLEHRRNEVILEPIAMVMRRLEWFGHGKRRDPSSCRIEDAWEAP